MNTKIFFSILLLFSFNLFAGTVDLPKGGRLHLDFKTWNVQSLDSLPGAMGTMLFGHQEDKELIGYLADGAIVPEGKCHQKTVPKGKWAVCVKDFPVKNKISRQLYLQRSVSKGSFQNYVIAFNVPKNKLKDSAVRIEKLKSQIGGK